MTARTVPETVKSFRRARCPMCKREEVEAFHPFCSKRCADDDLSRWLTGGYAIPAIEADEPDMESEA